MIERIEKVKHDQKVERMHQLQLAILKKKQLAQQGQNGIHV
jgi:hypothetical protein